MTETPKPELVFEGDCPDCGDRRFPFPQYLPDPGDDFDWRVRDYEGFRRFMLELLAAWHPERRNFASGDLETVLVEAFAAVLDQLSDMADRVTTEAYLETARRPESVLRLLSAIGYDAVAQALADDSIEPSDDPMQAAANLMRLWIREPHRMELARRAGPRSIHTQRRMVTTDDYARYLEDHPLVLRAHSRNEWGGSWQVVRVAVIAWQNTLLDAVPEMEDGPGYPTTLAEAVEAFHDARGLPLPDLVPESGEPPVIRTVLRPFLDAYRMAGQEAVLEDAVPVGLVIHLSVRVRSNYFQSEIRRAVTQALGTGPEGFFQPGRLRFGEDIHAGDIIEWLMTLAGVETVCLNRFKKLGKQFPDASAAGVIVLEGLEIAVCDNDPNRPGRGYFRLTLHGGMKG